MNTVTVIVTDYGIEYATPEFIEALDAAPKRKNGEIDRRYKLSKHVDALEREVQLRARLEWEAA